jgi:hypothetical protein
MRIIAVLACMLGLLGAIPAQAAELKDVFGREVPVGEGRPALVLYANRGTRDELREHAYQFVYDLRDIPGLFRGKARKEIRKSHRESLELVRKMFHEQGQEPPAELDKSLFMVADTDGAPHRQVGLKKGFGQVFAQAVSPSGEELARGPFPQAAPTIGRAIESAPAPGIASAAGLH